MNEIKIEEKEVSTKILNLSPIKPGKCVKLGKRPKIYSNQTKLTKITSPSTNKESNNNNNSKCEDHEGSIFPTTVYRIRPKIQLKRVETSDWGVSSEQLTAPIQLSAIRRLINEPTAQDTESLIIIRHIKSKISSYKQQDIHKQLYNPNQFIDITEILQLLNRCNLQCYYCSKNVFVLYENVRETAQWTLDRINNDMGHNSDNTIIACLGCNISRRRISKEYFFINKNLIITKLPPIELDVPLELDTSLELDVPLELDTSLKIVT